MTGKPFCRYILSKFRRCLTIFQSNKKNYGFVVAKKSFFKKNPGATRDFLITKDIYPISMPKQSLASRPIKKEISATDKLIADISINFGRKGSDLTVAM